jgi:hypothetical protein
METKIEHKYRVGDVFLTSDGWGEVLLEPAMGNADGGMFTYAYINLSTFAISHNYFKDKNSIKTHLNAGTRKAKFLFNLCDLFGTTRDALNEDTNT